MKIIFSVFLVMMSVQLQAESTSDLALKALIEFDLSGGRLSSLNWDTYTKELMTDVPEGYDEPGWDMVTLVDSYRVTQKECEKDICTYEVTYNLYPTINLSSYMVIEHPTGGVKKIKYTVIKRKNLWKVKAPQSAAETVSPHISFETFQKM
jgi:hypothetical protein